MTFELRISLYQGVWGEFELRVSEDSNYIIIETKSRCEGESECLIWKPTVKIPNDLTYIDEDDNLVAIDVGLVELWIDIAVYPERYKAKKVKLNPIILR